MGRLTHQSGAMDEIVFNVVVLLVFLGSVETNFETWQESTIVSIIEHTLLFGTMSLKGIVYLRTPMMVLCAQGKGRYDGSFFMLWPALHRVDRATSDVRGTSVTQNVWVGHIASHLREEANIGMWSE